MYVNHTLFSLAQVKVLEIFLDLKKHYFGELTKVTTLTRPRTLRALRELVASEILEVRTEANVKYYSLRKTAVVNTTMGIIAYNHTRYFLIKHKTLARALDMFKEKYTDYSVMLVFGSIVKGYAVKSSDIDVLLLKESVSQSDIEKVENVIDLINGRIGLKISSYLMTVDEFKKRNELAKQVIEQNILIDGAELFFKMVLS